MSLYGVLRSGISGMNAQSNKLGAVAENIANSNTTGYKRASVEFSSLILPAQDNAYNSGSVDSKTRYAIGNQGTISYTTSASDLAVSGNGFFVVSDAKGSPYLTRAGNFVVDGPSGNMVNAAGFKLMGYDLINNGAPTPLLNSMRDLVPVNISELSMRATPSTSGTFTGNLPYNDPATAVPPLLTKQSSLEVYDNVGQPVKLDITMKQTGEFTWDVTTSTKYGPGGPTTLTFDQFGQLTGPATMTFDINPGTSFTLDMAGMSQLAGAYDVTGTTNGNPPSAVKGAEFAADGTVYAVYEDGSRIAAYKVPLATVASPDNLTPRAGNVYETSIESGGYQVGFAEAGGLGSIASGALEQSNVDVGTELTNMIEAQTAFSANSKAFQAGSELLDVLINLKR